MHRPKMANRKPAPDLAAKLPRNALPRALGSMLLVALSASGLGADDSLPTAAPLSRYEKMLARSPFFPPTDPAPAPTPGPKPPGWSDELFVSGAMTQGKSNTVTLTNRSDAQRFTLFSGETNAQGLSLEGVEFNPQLAQTKVTVRKGTEVAILVFDEATLSQRGGGAPGPRAPIPPPPSVSPPRRPPGATGVAPPPGPALPGAIPGFNNIPRPVQPNPNPAVQRPVVPSKAVATPPPPNRPLKNVG